MSPAGLSSVWQQDSPVRDDSPCRYSYSGCGCTMYNLLIRVMHFRWKLQISPSWLMMMQRQFMVSLYVFSILNPYKHDTNRR